MQHTQTETSGNPEWIMFCAGQHCARLPFSEQINPRISGWQRVLDATLLGFRADRVGDTIVITGRPSDRVEGPLS